MGKLSLMVLVKFIDWLSIARQTWHWSYWDQSDYYINEFDTSKPLIIDVDTGGKPEHFEINVKTIQRDRYSTDCWG